MKKPEETIMGRNNVFCVFAVFFLTLYLLICLTPASANEDDWDNLIVTLSPENSVVSKDVYTLEALKFDGYGMVWIQVSKNGENLGDTALENNSTAWCYLDDNNVRLKACNVTDQETLPMFGSLCSPEAEIVFETKKDVEDNVALELDLDADKDEYLLDEDVIVDMELRNTGEVKTDKIKLDVDSDGLLVKEGVPESIMLDKGSKKSSELRFRFPDKVKDNYNITVNVNWKDSSGEHSLSKDVEIELTEPLEIYKNTGSEAFSGEPVYVVVSVKNVQKRAVNVSLFDLLPETFSLVNDSEFSAVDISELGNSYSNSENNGDLNSENNSDSNLENNSDSNSEKFSNLNWNFVLAPEEKKTISYYIKSEQAGAHRTPQVHAYSDLCGQSYAEISDSENIVTVYENISYKEYSNNTKTEVVLSSGNDLSAYLDKNGYALLNIWVKNEALDVTLFIPEGTRLLDIQKEPLKSITIKEVDQPSLPDSLNLEGNCYKLEPEGTEIEPYANLSLGLKTSLEGNFPSIYRYDEDKSIWTLIDSSLNEDRISAKIDDFSIYGVLSEPQQKVKLNVKVVYQT